MSLPVCIFSVRIYQSSLNWRWSNFILIIDFPFHSNFFNLQLQQWVFISSKGKSKHGNWWPIGGLGVRGFFNSISFHFHNMICPVLNRQINNGNKQIEGWFNDEKKWRKRRTHARRRQNIDRCVWPLNYYLVFVLVFVFVFVFFCRFNYIVKNSDCLAKN